MARGLLTLLLVLACPLVRAAQPGAQGERARDTTVNSAAHAARPHDPPAHDAQVSDAPALLPHREEVWVIEQLYAAGLARVLPLRGGPALLLRTAHLPGGVREGDVLVEGKLSPSMRASLLRAQRRRRAQAKRGGFTLADGGGDTRPLTAEGER